jgi:toxin CcdB
MAQFDVHKDKKGKIYPLLVDVQADLLTHLDTRVVVPLALKRTYRAKPMRILNPTVIVRNVEYVAVFQEVAAIAASELGDVVGSVASQRSIVIGALDFLLTGS